ncbi:MAG: hypothetical protein ALAOOOJD_03128 [bacterium]|nr:hypothetical protein [bacterium]
MTLAQAIAMLHLSDIQLGLVDNQLAGAANIGIAGIVAIDEALHEKIFVVKTRLAIIIAPINALRGADTGQLDLITLIKATIQNKRGVLRETEIPARLGGHLFDGKIPGIGNGATNSDGAANRGFKFRDRRWFIRIKIFPIIAAIILGGKFECNFVAQDAGMAKTAHKDIASTGRIKRIGVTAGAAKVKKIASAAADTHHRAGRIKR